MSLPSSQSSFTRFSQVPATCMGLHIRRASRIVTQIYNDGLRPAGLALNQFTLLVALHLAESIAVTRLAQELYTDQTTLTRNLKLLEQRGLITMAAGRDRRVRLVSLTQQGQTILAQALPLWEQAQAEIQQKFGQEQCQTLRDLLSGLTAMSEH